VKIFVYEHMNGGGLAGEPGEDSLRMEGWAMLSAVLADFNSYRCKGIDTTTLLDTSRSAPGRIVLVSAPHKADSVFRELAREADRTLVIAPETGGILEARCRWVEEEGGRLLGPSSRAVRLTADKLALASHLADCGIPTPATIPLNAKMECPFPFPVVVKPRDGAGSVATELIDSAEAWQRREESARAYGWTGQRIVQPYVPGRPASVAVLVSGNDTFALAPAAQWLSADGRFHYRGGSAPLPSTEADRAYELARRAVAAVPGLKGYVGVDLVLGRDGSESDSVIEINPRLTTSYIGLRNLARFSLAAAIVRACLDWPLPELAWHPGPVHWHADGTLASSPPVPPGKRGRR
jgi:predicted ATP-grasp superfamily ATP-dependent carboligase